AISFTNNSLLFTKTAGGTGYASRNTNFSPVAPTVLKIAFSFQLSGNTNVVSKTTQAQLYIGSSVNNSATVPTGSNVHSKLVFNFESANNFSISASTAPQATTPSYGTKQNVIWVINNSGGDITYKAPDGTTSKLLANNKWDLYVGASSSTPVIADRTALTNGVALQQLYFAYDTASENGVIEIDDILINDQTTVLPVSLTSFTAKANLQNVDLAWATASEKENARFDVLRSGDGKTFTKIGDVNGAGTTDAAKNYAFTDKNALPGTSYYQLRQVDNDGKPTLSEIVSVKSNVAASNFKVASNRQGGNVRLTVFAANEGKATFKIYDLNGRKLVVQELTLNKGYSNISIPFNGGTGLHIASLTTANETATQKFIQ
ncbi:MAG: T9SS type A sorting domain-containing protein, partial [Flavobacteriales bacterium]